jgi:hypothetical protein
MPSNALDSPARLRPAWSPSTALRSGVGTPVGSTGLLKPEINSAEEAALSLLKRPGLPKLNANRGMKLLAIALTHWKQRTATLSNRGEMRVVQPVRHMVKPASLPRSLEESRA